MSLILAISTFEGIILAADSRVGIASPRSREKTGTIGFCDHGEKVFPFKSLPIGMALAGNFKPGNIETRIESIVNEFEGDNKTVTQIHLECHETIRKANGPEVTTIMGGFENGLPLISLIGDNRKSKYPIQKEFGFLCLYVVEDLDRDEFFKQLTVEDTVEYARRFVTQYAQQEDYWKGIGGEVDVLSVSASGVRWVCRKPEDKRASDRITLLKLYQEKKLQHRLFDGYTEADLLEALRNG